MGHGPGCSCLIIWLCDFIAISKSSLFSLFCPCALSMKSLFHLHFISKTVIWFCLLYITYFFAETLFWIFVFFLNLYKACFLLLVEATFISTALHFCQLVLVLALFYYWCWLSFQEHPASLPLYMVSIFLQEPGRLGYYVVGLCIIFKPMLQQACYGTGPLGNGSVFFPWHMGRCPDYHSASVDLNWLLYSYGDLSPDVLLTTCQSIMTFASSRL